MFRNDSSVLTKYWAEIWWNPQIRLSKEVAVFRNRCRLKTAHHLRGALSDSPGGRPSHSLYSRKHNSMCRVLPIPKPQDKPITSIPQYIFAYPVKNKIHHLSKLLLLYWEAIKTGNLDRWRFLFLFQPISPGKWHESLARTALLLRWPQSRRRKTTLGRRQFRFLAGSLLTVPKNSQPQTTESLTQRLAAWAIWASLTQPDSPYL